MKPFGAVPNTTSGGSIRCHQSTVTMRFPAGLTSSKLALFSRSGTTSRTMDSEYLCCGEFFFHGAFNLRLRVKQPETGMRYCKHPR